MSHNSDYNKKFHDLFQLLPEVYQSDINKSLFDNLFNRFFSKPEFRRVDGFVGVGNPNSLVNRQIKEPSPGRQAFQLQPMLYEKVGTIEHMATWKDLLNELERLGVDLTRNKLWNNTQKFNWVPPIDIDKLLHFRDYYWFNPDNPSDRPQYFTIKNLCVVADSKVVLFQKILDEHGELHPIVNLNASQRQIIIEADLTDVMTEGFVFFTTNSTNPDIQDVFWTVESSEFDLNLNRTIITVEQSFTNDTIINGDVSLREFMDVLESERDCICNGSVGWDGAQWDDNQLGDILWNTDLLAAITHPDLASWVAHPNDPTLPLGNPDRYDIWYDTSTDGLRQWNGILPFTDEANWPQVQGSFSAVIALTNGNNFWDFSEECGFPTNQWVEQNKWLHRSVVPNFSIAKQAEVPIIEFSPFIELNEWTCTTHEWLYTTSRFKSFGAIDAKPSLFELVDFNTFDIVGNTIQLHRKFGDLTNTFVQGYNFVILNSAGSIYDVVDVVVGLGGQVIVSGDATGDYIDISSPNPNNLPTIFKIRNSDSGNLDDDYTIDAISYNAGLDETTFTIISTESIVTSIFGSAEVFTTNNGTFTVDNSIFQRIDIAYPIVNVESSPNRFDVTGDVTTDRNFDNFLFVRDSSTNDGVYTIDSMIFNGTETEITIKETIPSSIANGEIFLNNFRTTITVEENLNTDDGSSSGVEIIGESDGSGMIPVTTSQGDPWRDYDEHWLFVGVKSIDPINHQRLNPDVDVFDLPVQLVDSTYGFNTYNGYVSGNFEYKVNNYAQQFSIKTIGGLNKFELHPSLQKIARKGDDVIRVYLQRLEDEFRTRIIGEHTELTLLDMGVIGGDDEFVAAIEFNILTPIPNFAELTIEVGPATLTDIGFESIRVRTESNQDTFDLDPIAGSELQSLFIFKLINQIKTETNQYPLFDLYFANGDTAKRISRIFTFKENQDQPINFAVNRRIVTDSEGIEFEFEQELLDIDDGPLLAYRNFDLPHEDFYVNTFTNEIFEWTGNTWDNRTLTDTHYLHIISSKTKPESPFDTIPGQLWYNPDTTELKIFSLSASDFIDVAFNLVGVDPTLKTIWQPGLNDEEYVPEYVDGERNPVSVGDPLGDWEIPDPLFFNVHHENKKCIKLSELVTHFNTIIREQDIPAGFIGTPAQLFHILLEPNFGLGGTIREYNESFDTLLSSIFINNVTPTTLIEFAQDQYESSLNTLLEIFLRDAIIFLTNTTTQSFVDLESTINDAVITNYEQNDINEFIYGDSTAFDAETGNGIRNWIATLPFFGLVFKRLPEYISDTTLGINQIIHHDGHRSEIKIQDSVKENTIRKLLNTNDTRINAGAKFGNSLSQFTTIRPQTETDFLTGYSASIISPGKYWFETIGGNRILYRFSVIEADDTKPPDTFPDGTLWYDTLTSTLRIKTAPATWDPVTAVGDGILTAAWKVVDLNVLAANIILEAETRLFNAAPSRDELVFDFSDLQISEPTVYNENASIAFSDFVRERKIINPFSQQGVFNNIDPFTWNYKNSTIPVVPYTGTPTINVGGTWQDLYTKIYTTPYPHLEPWKLQGYLDKPNWWDDLYREIDGSRRWIYDHGTTTGMWENIRIGLVPAGELLPNGDISTGASGEVRSYAFMSVMIDDITQDGLDPDDLLPPFYDHRPTFGGAYTGPIRSLYFDFGLHIVQPNLDYVFNDSGLVEWNWLVSSQRLYDESVIAFKMQPMKFMHASFGINFIDICDLQVDRDTKKVYSHKDTLFHGDIINDNDLFTANGLNQWYTNFNRFGGFDTSASDFRRIWVNWDTPLTYQFASFVDTGGLFVTNKLFDIADRDFTVTMKKSPGIKDNWLDSLKIKLLRTAPHRNLYDTESEWVFDINTTTPIGRRTCYFEVKNFEFQVDLTNNKGILYKYVITDVDLSNNSFSISGDKVHIFSNESNCEISLDPIQFTVEDSLVHATGPWTVSSVIYDKVVDKTIIRVIETITSITVDGNILANYRTFDWETGQEIRLDSTKQLPRPFLDNTPYYIIKLNNKEFQLASSRPEALAGTAIIFDSIGTGQSFVGEITRTFKALNGVSIDTPWKAYAIDKTFIRAFIPPFNLTGVQRCIDFIFGYAEFTESENWVYNFESTGNDPVSGRLINWQFEIERFIDSIYSARLSQFSITDTFSVTADSISNEFTFTESIPNWGTGTKIILSSTGDTPTPIIKLIPYFVIRDPSEPTKFKLALTKLDASNNVEIDLLTNGTGDIKTQLFRAREQFPEFEVNPFRDNLWYKTPQGIVSNLVKGPFKDIRTEQTVFDQYGRLIDIDNISIYRQDKISKIFIRPEIKNDVEIQPIGREDRFNFLHIGGVHIFTDGFEHVIFWENYSSEGFLIYDPFIGLNTPKFDLAFDRQIEFTLRPNIGGQFLFEEKKLIKNLEGNTLDLQNAYDTYDNAETNIMSRFARKTLGYDGPREYLDNININDKSQFIFWRGMIQAKGSVNAAKAFVNSRRFIDARIDEYWAYKIAEFGDSRRKEFPEIKLIINDSLSNELKFEFIDNGGTPETNFNGITINDTDRWFEYPNQRIVLDSFGTQFYHNAEVTSLDDSPSFIQDTGLIDWFYITDVPNDNVVITHVIDPGGTSGFPPSDPPSAPPGPGSLPITTGILIDGIDYVRENSRLVRFLISATLPTGNPNVDITGIKVFTQNPAKSKHNTPKVIDFKSGVVVTNVPIWDPGRGHFFHVADNLIDLKRDADPAEYTDSSQLQLNVVLDDGKVLDPWNATQVGKVWQDTSQVAYFPYYDNKIQPNVLDRIRSWGKIADWANIRFYQWTKSDVHPSEWNELAEVQKGDITIDESIKKTGRVREVVFNTTLGIYEQDVQDEFFFALDPGAGSPTTQIYTLSLPIVTTIVVNEPVFTPTPTIRDIDVEVYVNEIFAGTVLMPAGTNTVDILPLELSLSSTDILRFRQPAYDVVTDGVREFPTQEEIDAGDYIVETPFSQIITKNPDGTDKITYYFWVEDKTVKINDILSLREMEQQFRDIPTPYSILQKFQKSVLKTFPKITLPDRYVQYIIRGLAGVINENERYKLRFTHDFTLRDNLDDGNSPIDLKNTHEEWRLFRQNQLFHLDRELWDKATEALMGESLDGTMLVPSLEKVLYDEEHGTDTRFGLEKGQSFVDKNLGIATVIADLFSPDNDFRPVDINVFVQTHSFDTPENIRTAMDDIFNSFASIHVNRIFFSLLSDSFSLKRKYPGIFKTSMLSLHGIRILERAGLFDD